MARRPQLVPWKAAGLVSERQVSGDDVVRSTGWVFNSEKGPDLTLQEFVATGDAEVGSYLTVFGLRSPDLDKQSLVEIGCGIGRMTCAFTREFGHVTACDLDAGFLERCFETVGRFGKVDRLRTSHVTDGKTLDLPPNSTDITFSYITFQHCDPDDALELTSEAVRITKPGGKVVLNYRARGRGDAVLIPLSKVVRGLFSVPKLGDWLSQKRIITRGREVRSTRGPGLPPRRLPVAARGLAQPEQGRASGAAAVTQSFIGVNPHHYWVIATVR